MSAGTTGAMPGRALVSREWARPGAHLPPTVIAVALAVATMLLGALCATSPRLAVAVTVGVAGAVALFRYPELLVPIGLLLPSAHFVPRVGIAVGPTYLTITQVACLLAGAVAVLRRRGSPRGRPVLGPAIALAGAVAAIGSTDLVASLYWVVNTGIVLMIVVGVLAPRAEVSQKVVHRVILAAGLVLAVVTILEFTMQRALLHELYVYQVTGYRPGGAAFRPPGLTGNPLVTAAVLATCYAVALVTPHLPRFRAPVAGVLAVAVLLTLSRSSIVVLVAATVLALASGPSTGRRLSLAAAAAGVVAFASRYVVRLLELRSGDRGFFGESYRIRSLRASDALDVVREHPLFGVGFGGMKRLLRQSLGGSSATTTDNMYLTLLAEVGLVGIVMIAIAAVIVWRRRVPGASLIPLVVLITHGLSFDFLFHDATIVLLGVLLADLQFGRAAASPDPLTSPPRHRHPVRSRTARSQEKE